ncbi:hypothetical protein RJ640_022591 [Escallonia rubra]|uniref:Uncharacterized protein n=1 Tax=Escallonia rubra TaxID=112253 RepID=A0AA88R5K8_9ASTE|nr:hypothetical protein RJ640_022591 [Escallonia rubra]
MAELAVNYSQAPHLEASALQTPSTEQNNIEAAETYSQHLMPTEESFDPAKSTGTELLDKGFGQHGCSHYQRRCRIRAPCCDEVFDCRHCHNEAKNSIHVDQKLRHDVPRHQIKQVICSLCGTEQEVRQNCVNCGVCMGRYFCGSCNLYDDDTSKKQYHCDGCGICRIGGQENFFHCNKCRCCFSTLLKDDHPCVEGAMHHDCPVCFEYLFETRNDVSVMRCGHTMHRSCLDEMKEHSQYACPLCCKSVCDMSKVWERLDMEVAATPMPENYRNKMVRFPFLHPPQLKVAKPRCARN